VSAKPEAIVAIQDFPGRRAPDLSRPAPSDDQRDAMSAGSVSFVIFGWLHTYHRSPLLFSLLRKPVAMKGLPLPCEPCQEAVFGIQKELPALNEARMSQGRQPVPLGRCCSVIHVNLELSLMGLPVSSTCRTRSSTHPPCGEGNLGLPMTILESHERSLTARNPGLPFRTARRATQRPLPWPSPRFVFLPRQGLHHS